MIKSHDIPKLAMLVALTTALSIFVVIPVPATNGFVTLCEVGIYVTALLYNPTAALIVGAASGGLTDMISGYPQWIIFSILIHGLQGLTAGLLVQKLPSKYRLLSLIPASIVMIVGYAFATGLLYGVPAGFASIPGNIIQNTVGALVSIPVYLGVRRTIPKLRHNQ
ncbi:MAG: ECF transporter S component [Enterococcaceae bacterium]|jgi:uncharacterized membrane protein|nr:ECF transporter S component [Enterococcaceae bacterium]